MKRLLYIMGISLAAVLSSCSKIGAGENEMTAGQLSLIGTAVNFNASMADAFDTKASSYTAVYDGGFNQNDRMRIYRNYFENGSWSAEEAFRTYKYLYKSDATTGIDLGKDWVPEAGRQGRDDRDGDGTYETFTQASTDSLIWENGKTVRFRAWSQSNYNNILNGAGKDYFYPDFSIAEYVNSSGPSTSIPLVLKHMGCRMVFRAKESGNEIRKIEICASIDKYGQTMADAWMDYKYADNAASDADDAASGEAGKTDAVAQQECASVTAVYRQMCMPAGVDLERSSLMTVKSASWQSFTDAQVRKLEEQDAGNFIKFGTMSDDEIAAQAVHPFFCNINTNQFMVSIPYNISSNVVDQGEVLTLPACTRFRVYMRDINNGDQYNSDLFEGKYHIFSLADVKNNDGSQAFPDGLKLGAGLSYTFSVGYRYGGLYVVVNNNLSWTQQDLADGSGTDETVEQPVSLASDYNWWKDAIHDAIPKASEDFVPVFKISTEKEFLEFIKLVNGTATDKTGGLYLLEKTTTQGGVTVKEKKWSTVNSIYKPNWVEESDMEKLGYIFYDHYHAANADKAAYSERDYVKGPYPFYDDNLHRNFTVQLAADLDLKDWSLESIGMLASTPFMGNFDGKGHTIKNVNMYSGCIFGYMNGTGTEHASITNLFIESIHNTCLLDTGVNQIFIAGISIKAPSQTNSIARSLSMETAGSATSYVVGCIHVGDAGGALVGSASDLNMFGCMQAATGISGGALIGTDANAVKVFKPQISLAGQKAGNRINAKPTFRNFIANYYDRELSPSAKAVGATADDYSLLEYIRGSSTDILRAKNNYLTSKVSMAQLLKENYTIYYGLAPWRAMNYAIHWYNKSRGEKHPCNLHFENNSTGYAHHYPVLVSGTPASKYGSSVVDSWNPVEQTN